MVYSAITLQYLHDKIRKSHGGQEIDLTFLTDLSQDRSDTQVLFSQ